MLNVAVAGYGYWGPNLVRNFQESGSARVKYVIEKDQARRALVQLRYPEIKTVAALDEVLHDQELSAVVIATPVNTHFDLALQALQAGKHVLVEKPLTDKTETCRRLMAEAAKRQLVLMVDHPFIYSSAVNKIKDLVKSGDIGDILYCDSTRINLGIFQHDVSVIWDLAVHDLSIMDYLIPEKPVAVSMYGMNHFPGQPENIAYMNLKYGTNCIGHIHVNWLAPVKIRQTLLCGTKRMIVYDDLNPDEKIKIYDKGVSVEENPNNIHKLLVGYRKGDIYIPCLDNTEPLRNMVCHFIDCVRNSKPPASGADSALRIINIMETACASMLNHGTFQALNF